MVAVTVLERNLLKDFKRFQVAVHLVSTTLHKHAQSRNLAGSELSHRLPSLFRLSKRWLTTMHAADIKLGK